MKLCVIEEAYFAEILDRETEKEVEPGQRGELVLTTLTRTACPLLRYRTGDLVQKGFVEDENGNNLLVLGLVTGTGWETPTKTLTRTKGKVTAVDMTGLFLWSGDVCYLDSTYYCTVEDPCIEKQFCCEEYDSDGYCVKYYEANDTEIADNLCADQTALITLECQEYLETWVFNIGDFVGAMWEMYADGNFKLVNIRFYPVK